MPTITYMSIEEAKEEMRQFEMTERIRRFATSDPEVAKKREAEGWGIRIETKAKTLKEDITKAWNAAHKD